MDKLLRGVGSVCVLWLNMKDESLHFSSHSCLVLSIISTLCVCVCKSIHIYIHFFEEFSHVEFFNLYFWLGICFN